MNKYQLFIALLCIPVIVTCSGKNEKPLSESQIREAEEALIGANRLLIKKDKEKIVSYNDSLNLSLTETETGLWYQITSRGKGPQVHEGSVVTINYSLSLLDGKTCYSSDFLGPRQFKTGQGGVETGLDEGVRLLTEGSEAIFILPPHLAHGLTGDGDCIPARSIVVYKVKLIKVAS